jgi:DNA polymerase (family X)
MDNYAIAEQLSLLAKLMDIHGENSFKAKSYASAAFALEKMQEQVATVPKERLQYTKGIGESVSKKIIELLETGSLSQLQQLIKATPEGVLEMLNIKGLGPKKIHSLWKEMGIDTIEQLLKSCEENKIAAQKGFGEKTQQKIMESIAFQQQSKGKYRYAKLESFAEAFTQKLKLQFPEQHFERTGAYRQQMEIIETLDWVTTASSDELKAYLLNEQSQLVADRDGMLIILAEETLLLRFYTTSPHSFGTLLFRTSSSEEFLSAWKQQFGELQNVHNEEEIFQQAGIPFIPAARRETKAVLTNPTPKKLIEVSDIKGLIHSHSNWSDGAYPVEQMAADLIEKGFEYLVISDHSKAAYYANGLTEQRIKEQHLLVDALNKQLAPFRIFKSIECDILGDGSLDYDHATLSSFDLVIASVHSNLDMTEEKAMMRLMGAIQNPYTTILGHMTGRLLLQRKGYPVDHKAIIDACAAHQVAIEINAHPARLDMDWRWIEYALSQGVYLSINPDAHSLDEFHNIKYGVLVAQKGGLTAQQNLSSFSLKEFEDYLKTVKNKKQNAWLV